MVCRGELGAVLEGELGAGVRIDKPMYDIMCVCVCGTRWCASGVVAALPQSAFEGRLQ